MTRTLESFFGAGDAFFQVYKCGGKGFERCGRGFLIPKVQRERLQTLLAGDHRLRAAFGLVDPTAAAKLKEYLLERQQHIKARVAATFFINDHGRPLHYKMVRIAILHAQASTGIIKEERPGHPGAALHALRHSFAVARLLAWYRAGGNVRAQLPNLSVCLGHLGILETYRYLSATPELLTAAS